MKKYGIVGLDILIRNIGKKVVGLTLLLIFLVLILFVSAQNIDYSYPADQWVDRVLLLNQSGYNFTADHYFWANGTELTGGGGGGGNVSVIGVTYWTDVGSWILPNSSYADNVLIQGKLKINSSNAEIISEGNMNLTGNSLTDVGELIVSSITLKGNMTPNTNDLYNLGSDSNWLSNLWVTTIYSDDIYAVNINASTINSSSVDTDSLNADDGDVENLSTKSINMGTIIIKNDSQDMVVVLG